ncbi:MAG: hypothetical protein ACI9J3_003206 [Parvicellaceae bacterium]|jgi:hypothetical protein
MSEFIEIILSPFGGVTVTLIALTGFLGHLSTKRIVNNELAQHNLKLESYKQDSAKDLQHIKDIHSKDMQILQQDHSQNMQKLQSDLKSEFLKFETYTAISQTKYQELFDERISVYNNLIALKSEIDREVLDNAEFIEFHDDDPTLFTASVKKVNDASQKSPMVISNELAELSKQLYEKSSQVFSDARVQSFYAEIQTQEHSHPHEIIMTVENNALRKMFSECGELYSLWFEQLNKDITKIRNVLDLSGSFLDKTH